jgi:hypothetical protein
MGMVFSDDELIVSDKHQHGLMIQLATQVEQTTALDNSVDQLVVLVVMLEHQTMIAISCLSIRWSALSSP